MAKVHGVRGWSTFGFTQLPIDGQVVPVMGLATHGGAVEPPTVSGTMLTDTGAIRIGSGRGPSEIELGALTLQQLGKRVGDTVFVGTGHDGVPVDHRRHGDAAFHRRDAVGPRVTRTRRDAPGEHVALD